MECWFLANYKAAYGETQRAQSVLVLVSPPTERIEVLRAEFKGVVPDDVIAELAARLYQESLNKWVPTPPLPDASSYVAGIIEHLDRFKAELAQIALASRGIGDNNPPEPIAELPVRADDLAGAEQAIEDVRQQFISERPVPAIIERQTWYFQGLLAKLKAWLTSAVSKRVQGALIALLEPYVVRAYHYLEGLITGLWHWLNAIPF
jgi:hypothetical protein